MPKWCVLLHRLHALVFPSNHTYPRHSGMCLIPGPRCPHLRSSLLPSPVLATLISGPLCYHPQFPLPSSPVLFAVIPGPRFPHPRSPLLPSPVSAGQPNCDRQRHDGRCGGPHVCPQDRPGPPHRPSRYSRRQRQQLELGYVLPIPCQACFCVLPVLSALQCYTCCSASVAVSPSFFTAAGLPAGSPAHASCLPPPENYGPRMLARNFDPGFFCEHFVKDLGIALEVCPMRAPPLTFPGPLAPPCM